MRQNFWMFKKWRTFWKGGFLLPENPHHRAAWNRSGGGPVVSVRKSIFYGDVGDVGVDTEPVALCSLCKDSVHRDLIRGEGTPIHLLPNGIASSRGEGWHSRCQGDGEVLLLIIAVDGGNNLSRHHARQLSIKAPLLFPHFGLLLPVLSMHPPFLHVISSASQCAHSRKPERHTVLNVLTRTARRNAEDKHRLQMCSCK